MLNFLDGPGGRYLPPSMTSIGFRECVMKLRSRVFMMSSVTLTSAKTILILKSFGSKPYSSANNSSK